VVPSLMPTDPNACGKQTLLDFIIHVLGPGPSNADFLIPPENHSLPSALDGEDTHYLGRSAEGSLERKTRQPPSSLLSVHRLPTGPTPILPGETGGSAASSESLLPPYPAFPTQGWPSPVACL
jgi:hypothetical protein